MLVKKLQKIFGIILAISLPLTVIGIGSIIYLLPNEEAIINFDAIRYGYLTSSSEDFKTFERMQSEISTIEILELNDHLIIKKGETNETIYTYDGPSDITDSVSKDATLSIKNNSRNQQPWRPHLNNNDNLGTLTISVGTSVRSLNIEGSIGKITIDALTLDSLDIDGGISEMKLTNLTIHQSFIMNNGVGTAEIHHVSANRVDIENGVGTIDIFKITADNVTLENGMGSVNILELQADKVDIDNGIGSIDISDSTIQTLQTSNGIGSIDITNSEIKNNLKEN